MTAAERPGAESVLTCLGYDDILPRMKTAVSTKAHVVILGELLLGIFELPPGKSCARLERWFEDGVVAIHCLTWDAATGLRWARLLADLRASGRSMPIKDSLIAATALTHGLAVVTRNRRDFANAKVEVVDPFA